MIRLWNSRPAGGAGQMGTTFKMGCGTFIKSISRGSPCGDRGLASVSQECTFPAVSLNVAVLSPSLNSWRIGGGCQCRGVLSFCQKRARIASVVFNCDVKDKPCSSALPCSAKVTSRIRISIHCCVSESEWEEVGKKGQIYGTFLHHCGKYWSLMFRRGS